MDDYSEISEDYSDDEAEGTTASEEGAAPEYEGTSVNYATAAWDGTPITVQSGDGVTSQLLGKYEGEEVSHRLSAGLVQMEGYDRTVTEYMSAEDREAFRLTAKDGKLYGSSGGLHSSNPDARGDYPGSTGGDIFVLDQGGLFAVNQRVHQDYLNPDPDAGDESEAASGVPQQSYTDGQAGASVNYTVGQYQEGAAVEGEGESVYRTVHHSTLAAGQRAPGDRTPLEVAAAGEIQTEQGEVRSISDASGHFRPTTEQTGQLIDALEGAGLDLDNTSINLVGKPGYDAGGAVPAVDVYSGEFKAAEGDQRALTRKRAAMEEIRAGFASGDLPFPDGLDAAEHEAEARSQRRYNDLDAAGVYADDTAPAPSLDDLRAAAADVDVSRIPGAPAPDLNDLRAAAAGVDISQIPGAPGPDLDDLRAAAAGIDVSQIPGAPAPSLGDLRAAAADVDVTQIPGGPNPAPGQAWQPAQPSGQARARRPN